MIKDKKKIKNETWHIMVNDTITTEKREAVCNCRHPSLSDNEIKKNLKAIQQVPNMINALIEAQEIIQCHTGNSCPAIEKTLQKIGIENEEAI